MAPLKGSSMSLDHQLFGSVLIERVHLHLAVSEICKPDRAIESSVTERHRFAVDHQFGHFRGDLEGLRAKRLSVCGSVPISGGLQMNHILFQNLAHDGDKTMIN